MCKIMMMNAIKKENVSNAIKFAKYIGKLMSETNSHGLGYAALDSKGQLFGERWLYNATAWNTKAPVPKLSSGEERIHKSFPGLSKIEPPKPTPAKFEYNSFGSVNMEDMTAITLHARMSTNTICIENTHPFVQDDHTSLIHNGVINNVKDFELSLSTCDSESILINYLKHKVWQNPHNIKDAVKNLKGYYACGVISTDKNGTRIMDIFRANNARLSFGYVHELGTFVFSTDDDDIKKTCRALGFKHDEIQEFNDEHMVRINAMTGKMMGLVKFKPASRWVDTQHDQSYWNNWEQYSHDKYDKHDEKEAKKKERGGSSEAMIAYLKAEPKIVELGIVLDIKAVVND